MKTTVVPIIIFTMAFNGLVSTNGAGITRASIIDKNEIAQEVKKMDNYDFHSFNELPEEYSENEVVLVKGANKYKERNESNSELIESQQMLTDKSKRSMYMGISYMIIGILFIIANVLFRVDFDKNESL